MIILMLELLALCGVGCIVAACWLTSVVAGLLATGVSAVVIAAIVIFVLARTEHDSRSAS